MTTVELNRRRLLTALTFAAAVNLDAPAWAQTATAAKYLKLFNPELDVTLIDRNPHYYRHYGSSEVVIGAITMDDLLVRYDALASKYGVKVVQDTVTGLDAQRKQVVGEAGRYAYDKPIVSPGIELHYDMLEGYSRESAETKIPCGWIAGSQTELLARQLCAMPQGGTFLLVAPPNPYRCPPGPYERAGKRNYDAPTKLMSEVAKGMTDKQIADVALYYETLAGPDGTKLTVGKTPEKVAMSGQTMQLISKGDPTRAVTPCAACHGTTAEGNSNGKVPVLQGQNQTYLAETLKQCRSGQRSSDICKEMRFFAVKLTDREIEELSAHYANEKGRNARAS